jgi:hypothetical protein
MPKGNLRKEIHEGKQVYYGQPPKTHAAPPGSLFPPDGIRNCEKITYTFGLPFCAPAALPEPLNTTSIRGTRRLAGTQNCCADCTLYFFTVPNGWGGGCL